MPTLHIKHPITDFEEWNSAFGRFAGARRQAGVRAQRVQRPASDPNYVVVDLDFGTRDEAEAFLQFLKAEVWGIPQNAPALAGSPPVKPQADRSTDQGPGRASPGRDFCTALARQSGLNPLCLRDGDAMEDDGPA